LPVSFLYQSRMAADERRNERDAGSAGSDGLMHAEEERHIAVDVFLLEDFGAWKPSQVEAILTSQHDFGDARRVVLRDDAARLLDGGFSIVGESRVHLSGDAAAGR